MQLITLDQSELPVIRIPGGEIKPISTVSELKKAEDYQKELVKSRTEFTANFKPVKQEIDKIKQQALDYEKSEIAKVTSAEDTNGKFINAFKTEFGTMQAELKTLVSSYYQIFEKCKHELSVHSKNIETVNLDIDRIIIQNTSAPAFEKAEKLEELDKALPVIVENISSTQTRPEEKVFKKKDEIKGREIFSVSDETAAIEWFIENKRSVLKIEIRQAELKKFLSDKKNQNLPFVKKEIVY